jgi:hypothetical protein
MKSIHDQLEKLSEAHTDMIQLYGEDNHFRLTGKLYFLINSKIFNIF